MKSRRLVTLKHERRLCKQESRHSSMDVELLAAILTPLITHFRTVFTPGKQEGMRRRERLVLPADCSAPDIASSKSQCLPQHVVHVLEIPVHVLDAGSCGAPAWTRWSCSRTARRWDSGPCRHPKLTSTRESKAQEVAARQRGRAGAARGPLGAGQRALGASRREPQDAGIGAAARRHLCRHLQVRLTLETLKTADSFEGSRSLRNKLRSRRRRAGRGRGPPPLPAPPPVGATVGNLRTFEYMQQFFAQYAPAQNTSIGTTPGLPYTLNPCRHAFQVSPVHMFEKR